MRLPWQGLLSRAFDRLTRSTFAAWASHSARGAHIRRTGQRLAHRAAARRAAHVRMLIAVWRMTCLEREVEKR